MTLRTDLDKLASEIAQKATGQAIPLQESVDALKALVPYYALLQKLKGKDTDDNADGDTFEAFSADIAGAHEEKPNGKTRIRGHQ